MSTDWLMILGTTVAAAVASPLGGLIAIWRKPTTLFTSLALGFASGILLGTIGFEMLPKALELASLIIVVGGFAMGFAAVCSTSSSIVVCSRATRPNNIRRSSGSITAIGHAADR